MYHKKEFVSYLFHHIHTNKIENLWKQVKKLVKNLGTKTKYLQSIARFYFSKKNNEKEKIDIIIDGLKDQKLESIEAITDKIYLKFS